MFLYCEIQWNNATGRIRVNLYGECRTHEGLVSKVFAAPVRTVCCFLLFCNSMRLSELRFASLLFQTHWKKRKKNCTNPSDSQQLWFYSRSSLALSSTHQKKSELTETMQ